MTVETLVTIVIAVNGALLGWIIVVERRLSRIEGYCKGKNCNQ